MKNKLEILAPAGSIESVIPALRCGATALYIGGKHFSARSNAGNFTDEEIAEAIKICHLYSAKLYIAVNTIIFDSETAEFCDFIKKTATLGVDAYIVQDLGCAKLIKECVPNAVLHASTQMTVHTVKGAELLKSIGFSRVIPARELSCDKIAEIASVGLEVETFIHGALCMSVSGQCYMSAAIGSRSANRGSCAQACRLPFSACGNKERCALSLKDLSLISHISELCDCGVCSLKIEGRMKRPEYVASAVKAVSDAVSGLSPDMELLKSVFSRDGFTDGYFTNKMESMFGTRMKSDVIAAKDVFPQIHELYRKERKIYSISFDAEIKENQPVSVTAKCLDCQATVSGDIPQASINRPVNIEFLEKQLSKLGDTVFEYKTTNAAIDDNLSVSASSLNILRRNAVEKIEKMIIEKNTPHYNVSSFSPQTEFDVITNKESIPLRVHCKNIAQAVAADRYAQYILLPIDLCIEASQNGIALQKIIAEPPRFICNENKITEKLTELFSNGITHLLCVNPAYIQIGSEIGFTLHGGFGLNVANSYSADYLAKLGLNDITLSFELKLSQLSKISSPAPIGIIAHGNLPLMLTRNCPIKNEIGCQSCKKVISDRTQRVFQIKCEREYVEILNSDILYMADRIPEISFCDFFSIILLNETAEETTDILKQYLGIKPTVKPQKFTRGLYYRGIE